MSNAQASLSSTPSTQGQIIWGGLALPTAQQDHQTDFAVYVEGNRICAAGARSAVQEAYPDAPIFGDSSWLLMPGLVNSHDHGRGLGALALGVPDDLLEIWLLGLSVLPPVDPHQLALIEGINLLHSGVTATAHSHNPGAWEAMGAESAATLHGYCETGIRVAFHPPYVDQNAHVYDGREDYLASLPAALRPQVEPYLQLPPLTTADYFALCTDLFERWHDPAQHRTHIQISPAGGQWCSDELILAARDWALARGTRVQMHLLETRYQARYAYRRWGRSFVRHLAEIGALGPWLTLAHMIWIEPADIDLLVEHGAAIAHNPSSNLRLRSGVAPLPAYWAAGLPVGIGLDGCALDDDQDYLRELRLAWTLANRPGAASATVPAAAVLHMGTAGGAAATFGPDVPLGRLQPGSLADLVLIDWRGVEGIWASPLTAPVDLLLRRGSRTHVRHVMVNGAWVLRDGRSTQVDEDALHAEVRADLQRWAGSQAADPAGSAAHTLGPYLRRFYRSWDDPTEMESPYRSA